jgi:hypothetical protein
VCGCLILLLGAFFPRLALVVIAIANNEITRAFDGSWLLPFFGWLVLPYATLGYVLLHWWTGDVAGFDWLVVAFLFLVDVSSWFGGWNTRGQTRTVVVRG